MSAPEKRNRFSFFQRFAQTVRSQGPECILRYRVLILAVFCLLTIAGAYGALHLGADFSIDIVFLTGDEEVEFFDEFKERFGESARDIIVLLTGEGLFDQEALSMLERLTGALEEIDGIEKVVTVLNAPAIQGTDEGILIEPLAEPLPSSPSEIAAMKQKALSNRLFRRWLISETADTLAVVARLAPYVQTAKEQARVVDSVVSLTQSTVEDRFPVFFSGLPTIQDETTNRGLRDTRIFFLLCSLILCSFLFITFLLKVSSP